MIKMSKILSKIDFADNSKNRDNPFSEPNFYTKIYFSTVLILQSIEKKFHKRPLKNNYLSSKVEDLGEIWDRI